MTKAYISNWGMTGFFMVRLRRWDSYAPPDLVKYLLCRNWISLRPIITFYDPLKSGNSYWLEKSPRILWNRWKTVISRRKKEPVNCQCWIVNWTTNLHQLFWLGVILDLGLYFLSKLEHSEFTFVILQFSSIKYVILIFRKVWILHDCTLFLPLCLPLWLKLSPFVNSQNLTTAHTDETSVADPWHFGVDPDPDPRIHASD